MRKAQITSVDLFIAIMVFLFLLLVTSRVWDLYTVRLNENLDYEKMQLSAFQITDLLVKNPGYPGFWEEAPSGVSVIGLAEDDRVLSQDKVTAFVNLDYDNAKEIFNIEAYDYKFRLKDLSSQVTDESGLDFTGDVSIVIERYVLLDNEKRILEFTMWK